MAKDDHRRTTCGGLREAISYNRPDNQGLHATEMDVAENLSPAGRLRVACYDATSPKSYGYYVPAKRSITIHGGWGDVHPLEKIAIHEYAHHIHFTEHRRSGKKDAPHGQNFWRIYSALVAKAIEKGLYNDNYINKIIEQEDE